MAHERLEAGRVLERMAQTMASNCEKVLDAGGPFLPSLMVWYEGEDLGRPGAVIVFEPPGEASARRGDALRMARERLDSFTREAAGWALAYEGFVSGNGDSSAALMIETQLRHPAAQATLVRQYRPRSAAQSFAWTGDVTRL
jgi:hypothetical protein